MSADRQAAVVAALLELADPDGPLPLATRLADHAVDVLGVAAAGVAVTGSRCPIVLAAVSADDRELHAVLVAGAESGPGAECVRGGQPVDGDDLARQRHRWLQFVAKADATGIRGAHALPLRHRGTMIGALLLLHRDAGPFTGERRETARALVGAATLGLQHERELGDASRVEENLRRALDGHVVIEQAKGVLAQHAGNDVRQAFDAMRGHARDRGRPVADVAADVVAGRIPPDAILPPH